MGKSPWDDEEEDNKKEYFRKSGRNSPNFGDIKMPEIGSFSPKTILLILAGLVLLWLGSGLYKVKEGSQGAVLRFGKYVRTSGPGLNYHLPKPFEEVFIESVNKSRKIEIGYRSGSYSNENTKLIPHESIMLTGDENIIDLNCNVIWHIGDLEKYLFNVADPRDAVKTSAESSIREVIGETPISAVLSAQKEEISSKIENLLQSTLDSYNAGIEIDLVQLLKAEPPAEVIDAYRDVQTSRSDKEREINQAFAYNNDILPRARGNAAKLLHAAEGYKQETILKAKGDSERFLSIYAEYNIRKNLTKNRLYLNTMEKILKKAKKYTIGPAMLPHMSIGNQNEVKK